METYRVIVETCNSEGGMHETELTASDPKTVLSDANQLIAGDRSWHNQTGTPFCRATIVKGPEEIRDDTSAS